MANDLDELTGPVHEEGRDARVIDKQLPVKVTGGTKAFQVAMWCLFIIPGLILQYKKAMARKNLLQQQQKIQHAASQIDNYLEQRVVILQNLAALINKEMEFEKSVLESVTAFRSGINPDNMNDAAQKIENVNTQLKAVVERYPELKSTSGIEKAMRDNDYLQREITAAREVYNDAVRQWNDMIYIWPAYQLVAAKEGYTSRIPFSTTKEVREKAREVLF